MTLDSPERGTGPTAPPDDHVRVNPVRVLVAEDDASVGAFLAALIRQDVSLELAGVAPDTDAAIALAAETRPDVALLDVNMPGGGGVRATREILRLSPGTQVVALSGDEDRRTVLEMVRGGAAGYLVKGLPLGELVAAIHRAARGESVLSPTAATSVVDEVATRLRHEELEAAVRSTRLERVRSLLRGDLQIAFQPIVDLRWRRTVGYEALARFPLERERGPSFWFAEAEAVGLRAELELKAVRLALEALPDLPSKTYLGLNVSPDVLVTSELAGALRAAPLSRLVLEVTEHAAVEDYEALGRALGTIRAAGARLAIDDAGAGFASLRHILRLAPDLIKLDVSLTRDIDRDRSRRALATALIAFADKTDAAIVAEGIEREAELEALSALGAGFGQGYFLARPALLSQAA